MQYIVPEILPNEGDDKYKMEDEYENMYPEWSSSIKYNGGEIVMYNGEKCVVGEQIGVPPTKYNP